MFGWILQDTGTVSVATTRRSVTFTVTSKNYFDRVGSKVTFRTYERKGNLYLRQTVRNAVSSSGLVVMGIAMGGSRNTWAQQAANLRNLVR